MIALTSTLAADHGAQGIRANCIILGPVFTPNINRNLTPERRALRTAATLTKREGTGWDTRPSPAFFFPIRPSFLRDRASASMAALP